MLEGSGYETSFGSLILNLGRRLICLNSCYVDEQHVVGDLFSIGLWIVLATAVEVSKLRPNSTSISRNDMTTTVYASRTPPTEAYIIIYCRSALHWSADTILCNYRSSLNMGKCMQYHYGEISVTCFQREQKKINIE